MRSVARTITVTLALCTAAELYGQQLVTRPLDLGSARANDTVTLKPGRYQFRITSLAPAHTYVIVISEGREVIRPISLDAAMGVGRCNRLKAEKDSLGNEKKESEIPKRLTAAAAALRAESGDTACALLVQDVDSLVAATDTVVPDTYDLGPGDYVIVDVSRIEDGKATQRWQRRFTTGAPGAWRATYGYGFPFFSRIHKWNRLVGEGQQFHLKQVAESTFIVNAQQRTRSFDALPTIMFNYAPAAERAVQVGWTAGIGTDINKAQVLTGPSVVLWSNLQLAAGVAFREEKVPIGKYKVGDTLTTNLDEKQLQDDAFRARPFVSVTLRFDKNPFKKESAGGGEQKKPEAKPDTKKEGEKPNPPTEKK